MQIGRSPVADARFSARTYIRIRPKRVVNDERAATPDPFRAVDVALCRGSVPTRGSCRPARQEVHPHRQGSIGRLRTAGSSHLQARVDGLALQREHGEHALMHAPQRVARAARSSASRPRAYSRWARPRLRPRLRSRSRAHAWRRSDRRSPAPGTARSRRPPAH